MQYKRDREVDSEILSILRYRMDDCVREEYPDFEKCFPLKYAYEEAAAAWFTKCMFIFCLIIQLNIIPACL